MFRQFFEENTSYNWRNYLRLTRLYPYQNLQTQIIKAYAPYSEMVKKYAKMMGRQVSAIDQQYLQKHPKITLNNIELLKNAVQLWKDAFNASESIEPVLYHYCFHCFLSFLNYTFFRWNPEHARSHGVIISNWGGEDENILDFKLRISKKGMFQRLIDTWTLLGGSIAFSRYIPVKREDVMFIENDKYLLKKSKMLSVKEILEFKPREFEKWCIREFNDEWIGCHYLKSSAIMQINNNLKNYLILFTASTIARYRPYLWIEILNGKTGEQNQFFQASRIALYDLSINNLLKNVKDLFGVIESNNFSITH